MVFGYRNKDHKYVAAKCVSRNSQELHIMQFLNLHSLRSCKDNHAVDLMDVLEIGCDVIMIMPDFCVLTECKPSSVSAWVHISLQLLEVSICLHYSEMNITSNFLSRLWHFCIELVLHIAI